MLSALLINLSIPVVLADEPADPNPSTSAVSGLIKNDTSQTDALKESAGFAGFDSNLTLADVIATVIEIALGLLGVVFIVLIVLSGYQWMTAGGNEEVVTKATGRIKNAIIGLVIVLAAYAITAFVFSNLPQTGAGNMTPITSGSGNTP